MSSERLNLELNVNGEPRSVSVEPRKSLADTLREDCRLTGTHLGCEQGVCGICTVLLDGVPVKGCIVLAAQADGHEVRTVECFGSEEELDDLQRRSGSTTGCSAGSALPAS